MTMEECKVLREATAAEISAAVKAACEYIGVRTALNGCKYFKEALAIIAQAIHKDFCTSPADIGLYKHVYGPVAQAYGTYAENVRSSMLRYVTAVLNGKVPDTHDRNTLQILNYWDTGNQRMLEVGLMQVCAYLKRLKENTNESKNT